MSHSERSPKVTKDLHRFAEEFEIAFQTYKQVSQISTRWFTCSLVKVKPTNWMKTANWVDPEKSLELQIGTQSPALLYNEAQAITK